jgi:hypothetical protein
MTNLCNFSQPSEVLQSRSTNDNSRKAQVYFIARLNKTVVCVFNFYSVKTCGESTSNQTVIKLGTTGGEKLLGEIVIYKLTSASQ